MEKEYFLGIIQRLVLDDLYNLRMARNDLFFKDYTNSYYSMLDDLTCIEGQIQQDEELLRVAREYCKK